MKQTTKAEGIDLGREKQAGTMRSKVQLNFPLWDATTKCTGTRRIISVQSLK